MVQFFILELWILETRKSERTAEYSQTFEQMASQATPKGDPTDKASGLTDHEEERAKLAKKSNSRVVLMARSVTFLALLVLTVGVSSASYAYMRNSEATDFRNSFRSSSRLVIETFHDSVKSQLRAIASMSASITSIALATNQSFPFVLVDNFEVLGAQTRVAAQTVAVQWAPIITDDIREDWEEYALRHRGHIDKAFERDLEYRTEQDEEFGYHGNNEENRRKRKLLNITDDIVQDGSKFHARLWNVRTQSTEGEGNGPYVVTWQRSPVNKLKQAFLNLNIAKAPALEGGLVQKIIQSKEVVINRAIVPVNSGQAQFSANLVIGQYRHDAESYVLDPISFVGYPVFDSFAKDRKLGGLVVTNLYWRLHFKNILPPNVKGIICVLENSFNQSLVYRLDGGNATFLGAQDYQSDKYAHMEELTDVNQYVHELSSPETRAYKTVPLSQDFGRYTLRLYPSEDTEKSYRSWKPLVFTLVLVLAFVSTAIVFVVYDILVEKRQSLVMERAVKSGAIVSSLFPETVRDRMYGGKKAEEPAKSSGRGAALRRLREKSKHIVVQDDNTEQMRNNGLPIADSFPETTVLFADIGKCTSCRASAHRSLPFALS